jgi:hypothetical protein
VSIYSSMVARVTVRAAFAILAALPFATANAEFVRVTAANALGNSVYDVTSFTPPPGTTKPLNTDGSKHGSFQALVQVTNAATGTVDVLVADALLGQIIRYTPALGNTPASETVVWSYTGSGSGPAHPDGLSTDGAGNLYIVTSKLFDGTKGAVWVLPANSTSATGYAASPLLIDGTSFSTANGITILQETAVASTTTAAWGVGDLLVLVGNKSWPQNGNVSELVVYQAASIAKVLGGAGPRSAPDSVLITNSQFPSTEFPTGMDFWPPDSVVNHHTLLIATTAGRILRYDFDPTTLAPSFQVFASNLGIGLQKVKVGLQLEVPYAFATQVLTKLTGRILQLGAPVTPGTNNLVGVATAGVLEPDGIAVARSAAVTAASCATPAGCDISNGVDPHQITGAQNGSPPAITGNVTEQTCVVLSDPRVKNGVCDGTELKVSTLCPGFGNEVLTGQTCGGSGISGAGFALVRTVALGVDNLPGNPLLVKTQEDVDHILPPLAGGANPSCQTFTQGSPFAVMTWATREELNPDGSISFPEGTIVETETDSITGQPLTQLVEMTGLCDNSASFSRGMSIYGVGLTLNPAALSGGLPAFAQTKATNLLTTVDGTTVNPSPVAPTTKTTLDSAISQISASINQGSYACAANQVVALDAVVGNDPNPAANYPGNGNNANPWGEIRGRLANLYVTLNTLILGNQTNFEWPLAGADSPPACPPVVTLSADTPNIQPSASSTLTWTSQYATSCTVSDGVSFTASGLSGTKVSTPSLTSTTTYTLTCTGFNNSTTTATATVTVVPPPVIGSFSATPSSISSGAASTLSWIATNATSCTISGVGAVTPGGGVLTSTTVMSITATTMYTLTCQNSLSVAVSSLPVTVTVVPPPAIGQFSASPTSISSGGSSTLSWTATNAASCTISGVGAVTPGGGALTSTTVMSITATTMYTLTCQNSLGVAVSSLPVTVTVVPPPQIASFTAPASVLSGTSPTLAWSASNATGCAIAATPGTYSVSSLAVSGTITNAPAITTATTYTLTCSNSISVTTSLSATVNVVTPPVIGSFTVSPTSVTSGSSPVISWTSNAMSCAIASTGSFSASGLAGSGTLTAAPINAPTTYTLACSNAAGGVTATATATPVSVTVVQPVKIQSFTANPSSVYSGKASSLCWSASTTSSNPTSCAITGGGLNASHLGATGALSTGSLKYTTTFTLTCSNSSSKATATTQVTVKGSDHDD